MEVAEARATSELHSTNPVGLPVPLEQTLLVYCDPLLRVEEASSTASHSWRGPKPLQRASAQVFCHNTVFSSVKSSVRCALHEVTSSKKKLVQKEIVKTYL